MTERGRRPADADLSRAELIAQLDEARETLRALQHGEVDAVVVADGSPGHQVLSLSNADRPYRMFLETMRDGAATVSHAGTVLFANETLATMLGRSRSQLLGCSITELLPADAYASLAPDTADAVGTVPSDALELELQTSGGQSLWVRVVAATMEVDDEPLVCLTFSDLTEVRRDQAQLTRAHQRALQELHARARFVANMSHEIRTPLNGVIGLTHLMLGTAPSDEQREYLDGILTSGKALMSVVDQILDFSKLQAEKLELENITFSPGTVLEEAGSIAAGQAHLKGVELLTWVADDVPALVSGDANRLRQILNNLATNAVKFTAAGEVCLRVRVEPVRAKTGSSSPGTDEGPDGCTGWRLLFTVTDSGIGIPADARDHIFDAFAQADGSTTRRFGGTGLGLAICKQLVELMDGEIGVNSVEGEGSTFWFSVHVAASPPAAEPVRARPALEGKVLVVDDNATSRQLLADRMTSWGLHAAQAVDAKDALSRYTEAAGDDNYDVVLVDCDMPAVDGVALTRMLRAHDAAAGRRLVPIVMLMSSQRQRQAARLAGVDGFVTKPVRLAQLELRVLEALQLGRLGSPGGGTGSPPDHDPLNQHPHPEQTPAPPPPGPVAEAGQRVLLAEDNQVNQLVASRMLSRRGYHVDVAANGQLALELAQQHQYAVIFMDCQMPVLDGYQATVEIRRRENGHRVPILALTANLLAEDRERCLKVGMDGHLGKPFTSEMLDEALALVAAPAFS